MTPQQAYEKRYSRPWSEIASDEGEGKMNKQPEALRLADRIDLKDYYEFDASLHCQKAAAELRRLYDENRHLVNALNHVSEVRSLLVEQRDELLYALQQYLAHASEPECAIWRHIQQKARTAIAKATGE